jgi:nicotinamidase-related amidase
MSEFGANALDYILKSRGIRNVAVGGFTADVCVYATLLGGYDLGYRMYAMTDAVVSGDAALTKEIVGLPLSLCFTSDALRGVSRNVLAT